jgi:sulfur relay protein TusB/DsrH
MNKAANIVLIQNAAYFAEKDRLDGLSAIIYVLEDDIRLRGLRDNEINKGIKKLDYDRLIELMIEEDKVIGIF